jgi:hypothetical protein
MALFESKVELNIPVSVVYAFLSDFNNHKVLMPENISNWSSTTDEASFSVQNMAELALMISNRIQDQTIIIVPSEEAPFNVEMRWVVADLGSNTTEAILTITAELNMMLKTIASGPLQKLVDHQTKTLRNII